MKLETQFTEDHQARLTVEVEDERLETMKRRAAGKLARKVKIPGFRPGKAPYAVVQRTVGEGAIFEEALELLIDEIYPEAIKQAEIQPYGPGRLENLPSSEPLKLEFIVPLEAVVTLGDYKSISQPYEPEPVTDAMVEEAIESLRARQAILEPVERPAEVGDVVTITISGKILDDVEEKLIVKERSVSLLIRDRYQSDEWPFPTFSKQLIGKSPGDQDSSGTDYPPDYMEAGLQNKYAEYEYKVEDVKSRTLPELDDNFAASVGDYENVDALRKSVIDSLQNQVEQAYNETYDEEIITLAVDQATFQYSPQMLDDEIHQAIHDLEQRLERQGLDLAIYLKSQSKDEAALHEDLKPIAEKRLKRSLLLYELGKAENIQIEQEELANEAGSTLNYLQQVLPEKEARRLSERNVQSNVVNNVLADLLARKTISRLRSIASGRPEAAPSSEAEAEPEPEAGAAGVIEELPIAAAEAIQPEPSPTDSSAPSEPAVEGQETDFAEEASNS